MKIIEGMKKIKDLQRKAEDLRGKVKTYAAYLNYETPAYPDQKGQVSEWIQAHSDILKEILKLRIAIQKTNLETKVSIELGEKVVEKTIAEWIHRRRDLAKEEKNMFTGLSDKGLQEGMVKQSTGETMEVKIVRCFDAADKDKKIDLFQSEPGLIDARLEVINAITDLVLQKFRILQAETKTGKK